MKGNIDLFKKLKWWQHQSNTSSIKGDGDPGFTLLEVLIVVFMVGILAAIGSPSWISMLNNTRIKKAIAPIEQAIRQAQSKAKQQKSTWQASFRETTEEDVLVVQWAVHPEADPSTIDPKYWQTIDKQTLIKIEGENTTLASVNGFTSIKFDEDGNVSPEQLGRITVNLQNNPGKKRCVKVLTILGSIRTDQNDKCTE